MHFCLFLFFFESFFKRNFIFLVRVVTKVVNPTVNTKSRDFFIDGVFTQF